MRRVPLDKASVPFGTAHDQSSPGHVVGELLPPGYARYLRVLFPILMDGRRLRWRDVLGTVVPDSRAGTLPEGATFDGNDRLGRLPDAEWRAVMDVFGEDTPVRVYCGLGTVVAHGAVEQYEGLLRDVTTLDMPEYVWTDEWVANTDYDLWSTYVACDDALAERLLAHPALEVVEVTRETRVDELPR